MNDEEFLELLADESGDTDFLKQLEDIDRDEDWSEIERLCGTESLCCVSNVQEEAGNFEAGHDEREMDDHSSTSSQTATTSRRFKNIVDEKDVEKAIVSRVPKNTSRSTNWGVGIFQEWCTERKIETQILSMSEDELNRYIARFVHEAVKKDGETPYPPNSLYQIVVAIQRFLRENGRPEINFFDQVAFDTLQKSLDARMKELTSEGFGTNRRQAQPISKQMEATLWEKEIFSRTSGEGLLNIVYYYNCKLFGLRAGDEHRALCVEQFCFGQAEDGAYMQFTGRSCKTYQGGLHHRKLCPKELKIFAFPELGERDIVDCFRLYMSMIPSKGPFYRRPVKSAKEPKFSQQIVGKNTLSGLVQKFCSQAGFDGFYTGHSGKVTCATELFGSMVDEQLIQHYTGHRSVESVRQYKRAREDHFKQVSRILQPPPLKIRPAISFSSENDSSSYQDEQNNQDAKQLAQPQGTIANGSGTRQPRVPRITPLEDITNSVGAGAATIQATNGGNITFNFNFR